MDGNTADSSGTLILVLVLSAVAAALLYYLKISRDESSKKDKRTKELQDKLKKKNESHDTKSDAKKNLKQRKGENKIEGKTMEETITKYVEQDWNKVDVTELLDESEKSEKTNENSETQEEGSAEEESGKSKKVDENSEFYCAACKKSFKSTAQWKNHEKSKKHIETQKKFGLYDASQSTTEEVEYKVGKKKKNKKRNVMSPEDEDEMFIDQTGPVPEDDD